MKNQFGNCKGKKINLRDFLCLKKSSKVKKLVSLEILSLEKSFGHEILFKIVRNYYLNQYFKVVKNPLSRFLEDV